MAGGDGATIPPSSSSDGGVSGVPTQSGGTPAKNVGTWVNNLGACVHLAWAGTPYANATNVANALDYIGFYNVRDVFEPNDQFNAGYATLLSRGKHVNMVVGQDDIPGAISALGQLETAHPGGVRSIEGPNEVDNWPLSYHGQSGASADKAYQKALYQAVKADSLLGQKPVYMFTFGGLTLSNYQSVGDLSAFADYANQHIYYGGGQPAYGWSPGDTTFHWQSWTDMAKVPAPNRQVVITETGASTSTGDGGVSEAVQARTTLNSLMDAERYGDPAVFLYELMDSSNVGPDDYESHFGLYRWDGSAKPAATFVHNLTTILTSGGASEAFAPGALNYSVAHLPDEWAGQLLFQGGDGTFYIVIWTEPDIWNETNNTPIASPTYSVDVSFGTTNQLQVYDPAQGTSALETVSGSAITVKLTDHPIVVSVRIP